MGLGPSMNPKCRHCDFKYPVCYVMRYHGNAVHPELDPWFDSHCIASNRTVFLACGNCIRFVPSTWRNSFEYIQNYTVHGM